eukprot:2800003-Rhodomonas_salina.2
MISAGFPVRGCERMPKVVLGTLPVAVPLPPDAWARYKNTRRVPGHVSGYRPSSYYEYPGTVLAGFIPTDVKPNLTTWLYGVQGLS